MTLAQHPIGALVAGLIDYAGLFPPAGLSMRDAVRAYDDYRRSDRSWALGRFVVPCTRLRELTEQIALLPERGAAWSLSVLGDATDQETIARFNDGNDGNERYAVIEAVEVKASSTEEIHGLAPLAAHYEVYAEVPISDDPLPLIAAIAAHPPLRAKIRTGGVTAEAFPGRMQVVRFLAACAAHHVPFKATAGLHHPQRGDYRLTYDRGSAHATMFGFLNLFVAAILLRSGLSEADAALVLDDRDLHAFIFDDHGVSWHGHRLNTSTIHTARKQFATAFGSCSFIEPMDDLHSMGLL